MRLALLFAIVAATCQLWSPVEAAPDGSFPGNEPSEGYTYFNRPGADVAKHDAELKACLETTALSAYRAANGPARHAAVWGRQIMLTNAENCMLVRGWRVFRLPDVEGRALDRKRVTISATIAPWVGADTPPGRLVRVWSNDGGKAVATYLGAFERSSWSLSLESIEPPDTRPILDGWAERPFKANLRAPKPLDKLDALPADQAILIVSVAGSSLESMLRFNRAGPNYRTQAWTDGRPDILTVGPDKEAIKQFKATGHYVRTYAFSVAPGLWRLYGSGSATQMCLGAPAAEVRAGDVVYLGSFELASGNLTPNMSIEAAEAVLSGSPASQSRLRAAEWRNGSVELCDSGYSYAIEFPGFPSIDSEPRP